MRRVKWVRRAVIAVTVSATLLVGLSLSASASVIVQSERVAVTAGQPLTIACPSGERFVSGTASFYKSANTPKAFADVAFAPTADNSGGTLTVPKGAKYAIWIVECELIQTVTFGGIYIIDGSPRVLCPAETPYVQSVDRAVSYDPISAVQVPLIYEPIRDANGAQIGISSSDYYNGWNWHIVMTCSDQP